MVDGGEWPVGGAEADLGRVDPAIAPQGAADLHGRGLGRRSLGRAAATALPGLSI